MNSNTLIALVRPKPEIWDRNHTNYTNKSEKLKVWKSIAGKLGVTIEDAKVRWTQLRDVYRREYKKNVKITEETGDPKAYKSRWKHFKYLTFLNDQMTKYDTECYTQIIESGSLYPRTSLENGNGTQVNGDNCVEEGQSNQNNTSHYTCRKRKGENNTDLYLSPNKRHNGEDRSNGGYDNYSSRSYDEMDDDYHFVMSILPSVRRIRQGRKTNFKMKILQLIKDEERVG